MSKKLTALVMAATVGLSGVSGYVGSTLALKNTGANQTAQSAQTAQTANTNTKTADSNSASVIPTASSSTKGEVLSVEEIAKMNENSVVEITTEKTTSSSRFGQFVSSGAGSGVVMSNDGYIITNNHVVEGASKISVRLKNGQSYDAKLVGTDSKTDIAVIKVNATNLIPVTMGQSDTLQVGELAVAIGNPLGELGGTVTEGIISALDRDIVIDGQTMKLLQTSAAINPGNSGGGLFDKYGKLVGIVNSKSSGSGIEGLGFAVPINTATQVASDIISYGYVKGRTSIGISIVDIDSDQMAAMYRVVKQGVYVSDTTKNNGLQSGDRFISIDGKDIKTATDITDLMTSKKAGDKLTAVVERNGKEVTVNITLTEDKN